jgi:predicted MPP superfamily phosphohydrolase
MGTRSITILALAVAAAGVAVLVVGLRRRPGRLDLRLLAAVVASLAVAAAVAAVPVIRTAQHSWLFPLGHLAYLVAVVAVPILGVAIGVSAVRRGATRPVLGAVAAMVLLAPVGAYATHVAPFDLRTVEVEVDLPRARAGTDPVRLGILADLQTDEITDHEHRAVDELLALEPDIVVIAGDFFQGSERQLAEQLEPFRALLRRIDVPGGVFAVRGDTDVGDRLDRLVEGTDIEILDHEVAVVQVGDRTVRIGGNELLWAPLEGVAVRDALRAAPSTDLRILLAHRPDVVLGLPPDADIDLTVAGHTHGGQISIPFFGPPVTFTKVPRSVAAGGLHEVAGNRIFVSTGVGIERIYAPQVRLFTRPMVAVAVLD